MCWIRTPFTVWILLLVQLLCSEAVPISIDKTKVEQPEKEAEKPPASVVRTHNNNLREALIATIRYFTV